MSARPLDPPAGRPAPVVLLDLDGTLTDSYPGIAASARAAYTALGLPVPDDATLRTFVGPPITGSFAAHGVPADRLTEAVAAYRVHFRAGGMWDNRVYDGVDDQLRALRAAGARLAVATSKPEVFAQPICERFGLAAHLEGVFGAPLDHVPSTKADVIARALAVLGAAAPVDRAVMVGDREHDVHGAAAHGIACVGVGWGYASDGELVAAGAVEVVADVADLAARVLAHLG
ncbi:HAD hydrolase-like protein [Cellulomonas oligotrophica]|uniref:5'-nucleotidase n=1 Tax=Cellulomonas oligotrophica TaxID=931536 RepID=A0A7Y9FIN6_9CELL|nr:HAD hydrolase-like protein [Cellulomonas oligotrophica]NYD88091.1 phosphoglycolate phosphatase [Cellulomonas oligotrophica]GIG33599.1 5'-nucleotidase [Cellulomonas oligotrophica]